VGLPKRGDQKDIRGKDAQAADDEKEEETDCTREVRQVDGIETILKLIFKLDYIKSYINYKEKFFDKQWLETDSDTLTTGTQDS
jgi:hypothetical protein